MKILIELDEEDGAALDALAEKEVRSRTAQAKKILIEVLRPNEEEKEGE